MNQASSPTSIQPSVTAKTPTLGSSVGGQPHPLQQAVGVYVTLHGHFYQPPRENPYLGTIERQSSAEPFHDWNERIYHECYRPNAFARIFNDQGEIVDIVNNFEYLSFNVGPTLMSWLERYDSEVYQRIILADRRSCQRLGGHGNAIAQVYNHVIMPLANQRDKLTQVRWGKADFQARFGREPEGMWLAEAAVDQATLAVLIAEGIRFIILAPSQAQRCRPMRDHAQPSAWQEVGGGQIDPTQPYRCFLADGDRERDYIDIFFYDGPISRDIGFKEVLSSSEHLAQRLGQAVRSDRQPAQLISVATDGETFGHHKHNSEKAIAYAFCHSFPQRGWTVTNYAHYLSLQPPRWEVELKPVTAWSCSHGVDRWQADCGCGGEGSLWHQKWRRPLRQALDWLRDQLSEIYIEIGEILFQDPWLARDHYIQVMGQFPRWDQAHLPPDLGQDPLQSFLAQHQAHPLTPDEQVDALRLLEMQRHGLLMYTSCGWFFAEISRPEGVQILQYAARAIALATELTGVNLETEFLNHLSLAPSNVDLFQTGTGVYRQLVIPSQVDVQRVAAHYAMTSLFSPCPTHQPFYHYQTELLDYQVQRLGSRCLAVGQLRLTSNVTHEIEHLCFGVLHLGDWDFHCGVQVFTDPKTYTEIKTRLFDKFQNANAAEVVLTLSATFGDHQYGLTDLLPEERHRLISLLSKETLSRLNQLYSQVYRDNYGILMAFQTDNLEIPPELLMAAQVALTHRAMACLQILEQELSEANSDPSPLTANHLHDLAAIATEAEQLGCRLNLKAAQQPLQELILRLLWQLFHGLEPDLHTLRIQQLQQLLALEQRLQLDLRIDPAQELYFHHLQAQFARLRDHQGLHPAPPASPRESLADMNAAPSVATQTEATLSMIQLRQILQLGRPLGISVQPWLDCLAGELI